MRVDNIRGQRQGPSWRRDLCRAGGQAQVCRVTLGPGAGRPLVNARCFENFYHGAVAARTRPAPAALPGDRSLSCRLARRLVNQRSSVALGGEHRRRPARWTRSPRPVQVVHMVQRRRRRGIQLAHPPSWPRCISRDQRSAVVIATGDQAGTGSPWPAAGAGSLRHRRPRRWSRRHSGRCQCRRVGSRPARHQIAARCARRGSPHAKVCGHGCLRRSGRPCGSAVVLIAGSPWCAARVQPAVGGHLGVGTWACAARQG